CNPSQGAGRNPVGPFRDQGQYRPLSLRLRQNGLAGSTGPDLIVEARWVARPLQPHQPKSGRAKRTSGCCRLSAVHQYGFRAAWKAPTWHAGREPDSDETARTAVWSHRSGSGALWDALRGWGERASPSPDRSIRLVKADRQPRP